MKETINHQLGHEVRALRKKYGLTQEGLAGTSGISLKYIQRIEGKDPSDIGLEMLEKLAKGFDISLSELLKFKQTARQKKSV